MATGLSSSARLQPKAARNQEAVEKIEEGLDQDRENRRRNRTLEDEVRVADAQALDDRLAVASAPYQCRESGVAHVDDRAGLDSGQNRARGHRQKDLAELGKGLQSQGGGRF